MDTTLTDTNDYEAAVGKLRGALSQVQTQPNFKNVVENRDSVLARYQPVFQFETVQQLSEENFRSFLYFENNHHWSGLYRKALKLCEDMDTVRNTLTILLNPALPLAKRWDTSVRNIKGFGKGLATAILIVSSPNEYGVWNNTSEGALRILNIWPEFPRGSSRGEKYVLINQLLNRLSSDLGIDLWTLDALMWGVIPRGSELGGDGPIQDPVNPASSTIQAFGLERHLHDFLFDNWEYTSLGKEWALYEDESGYEYPTEIGYIDLLAHHRKKPEWLVIELKRGKSSDETVGQVLRYMGWVRNQLAEKGDTVKGLIISREADDKLLYAISALDNINISVQTYEVEFLLKPVNMSFKPSKKK